MICYVISLEEKTNWNKNPKNTNGYPFASLSIWLLTLLEMNYYAVAFPERDNAINNLDGIVLMSRLVTKSLHDRNHKGKSETLMTNAAMFT